jgi:hypothetical protein
MHSIVAQGQTNTIKIRKQLLQDKIVSPITIGGLYDGKISVSNLINTSKFKISNNQDNLRVVSYKISLLASGDNSDFNIIADSLTPEVKSSLSKRNLNNYNLVSFQNIKAVNSKNDTIFLNPIELKLVSENELPNKIKGQTHQNKMVSVVTLAGIYTGTVNINTVLTNRKFRISNNVEMWKIIRYDLTYYIEMPFRLHNYSVAGDSLSIDIISDINEERSSSKFPISIKSILAVNFKNDTVFLNPININITRD